MALRMNHPSSGKTGQTCASCGMPASRMVVDRDLGRVFFCSNQKCYDIFYPEKLDEPNDERAPLEVHLKEIRINALIVGIVDYRTIKVLFVPYGNEMPVTVRLANGEHFNSHEIKSDEEKIDRMNILNGIFFPETERTEPTYPIASVIPVGQKQGKSGLIILVTIYVPSKCTFDERLLVASAEGPLAVIGDLATSQSFLFVERMEEKKLRQKQLTQESIDASSGRWMQNAVKHPYALTRWGHAHHIIKSGQHWSSGSLSKAAGVAARTPGKHDDRMVSLAKTFARFRHHSS